MAVNPAAAAAAGSNSLLFSLSQNEDIMTTTTKTISIFRERKTGKFIDPRSPDFVLSPWEVVAGAEDWDDVFSARQEIELIEGYDAIEIESIENHHALGSRVVMESWNGPDITGTVKLAFLDANGEEWLIVGNRKVAAANFLWKADN